MTAGRIVSWLIAASVSAVHAQQAPVFRGGVDLVSVDVVVLDRAGAPVDGLTARDFTVVAGKTPRRIVSAEFIRAGNRTGASAAASSPAVPSASSNARQAAGRTIIFVVDVENILSGEGRLAVKGIADYLDRLGPDDRVGVMTLPSGTPRVEPTTDRGAVREAIAPLAGISMRLRDREMTFGEAAGIAVGDRNALAAYWYRIADQGYAGPGDRTCAPPKGPVERTANVSQICVQAADRIVERARYHSRGLLDRLRALSVAMAPLAAPKSIVLVSGGMLTDSQTLTQMAEFSAAAERARVSLYSLLIEAPPVEASAGTGNTTATKRADNQVGLAGLSEIALSARGAAQSLQGQSTTALERIDRELSGYYLITFERDAADREGARVSIDVRTTREGLDVIARKEFTAAAAASAAATAPVADPKAAIADLLKSPNAVTQVPIDVDAYALPIAGTGGDARGILAIEIGRPAAEVAAIGFQVATADGTVVADGYEAPAVAQKKGDARSIVLPAVPVTPGRFIARIAVLDAQGQSGTVQHAFEVLPWGDGPIRLSDLIFGDMAAGAFRPAAHVPAGDGGLALRLVVRDSTSAFAGLRVRALVTNANQTPIESIDVPLQQTPDPLRRFADVELKTGRYPAGEYVVTTIVTAGGRDVARRSRAFRK